MSNLDSEIKIRIGIEDKKKLQKICRERGWEMSELIRRLIQKVLAQEKD